MKIKDYAEIYGLFGRGYEQQEIAQILKINQATVSRALAEIKRDYPGLFPADEHNPKVLQYTPLMDAHVKEQF